MYEEERDTALLAPAPAQRPAPASPEPLAAVKAVADPDPVEAPPSGDGDVTGDRDNDYGDFDWPEGYAADPAAMAKFVPLARKLGLPREGAQELANLYVEIDREKQKAQAEFIARNNADWLKEIHSHPEFGGANLQRASEDVAGMMRRFGSPLLLSQLRQMNIQNWPEMFFFLARVSHAVSEDCSPSTASGDRPAKSTAQLLFPGLN